MIKVYCNGTRIQCLRQGELNVGMAGAPIEFDFSSEWDGLGKTAVFRCDGSKDMIIGADGKTTVPHEILNTPGMDVEVGVYAKKEDGTTWPAPTTYCKIGRVGEGADPSGDESYPPTPDVGEQAVAVASKALEAAAEAREVAADIQRRADAGEFDGAPGYTPVKGEDYFDGNDYVLTEADKVEIAEIAADLVDVPESGGSADLTGYATEEWVEKGYQPKGDYATKDEIPPVPTKLSAFTNDAGFVTEDALKNVGRKAYVQDTEPAQMEVGEFWYNPDEETEGIPTTLPNPHKLTFSGAVSAEYDGSEAVEVVIPQGGGGGGGGASKDAWRLIRTITTTEEVTSVEVSADENGKPFSCKKVFCRTEIKGSATNSAHDYLRVNLNANTTNTGARVADVQDYVRSSATQTRILEVTAEPNISAPRLFGFCVPCDSGKGESKQAYSLRDAYTHSARFDTVTSVCVYSKTGTAVFGIGTTIEVWGVDA